MLNEIKTDMYAYETHVHTCECSLCAKASGSEQADFYKAKGYAGIIVTDHFFNGNTAVPRDLPWNEKVERFMKGFEAAKSRGEEIGLDVFFGWEFGFNGADLLTYGLDKSWLLAHENVHEMNVNDYCELVRADGGMIVHAHPFREDWYIEYLRLFPRHTDAVEAFNACRKDFENDRALEYANAYGLKITSGSDNHTGVQARYGGVCVTKRFETVHDYIKAVKTESVKLLDIED